MTTIEHYLLSTATAKRFKEFRNDQSYYSEEYAMNEFLNQAGVKGYVTRIKHVNGCIRVRMCIDELNKKTNQFYFDQLINHELNDQR